MNLPPAIESGDWFHEEGQSLGVYDEGHCDGGMCHQRLEINQYDALDGVEEILLRELPWLATVLLSQVETSSKSDWTIFNASRDRA